MYFYQVKFQTLSSTVSTVLCIIFVMLYQAQRGLLKLKNIIKLQAAFRGHIVRKHATGTLRCALAIIKMQALVRGRHARRRVEGSNAFEKQSENCGNAYHDSTIVGMVLACYPTFSLALFLVIFSLIRIGSSLFWQLPDVK